MTREPAVAREWLSRFEGAGLDGVIAKPRDAAYEPGKRAMLKVKHARTADCVVAGFRWHKAGKDELRRLAAARPLRRPGSAASCGRDLVIHDGEAEGAGARARAAARTMRSRAIHGASGPTPGDGEMTRMPGGQSRWSAGKDLSWEPLRIERVCEVKYDHMQGRGSVMRRSSSAGALTSSRATAATISSRSRPPYELEKVFGAARRRAVDVAPVVGSRRQDRALPVPDAARPARAAGSPGSASRCETVRAWHRPARRPAAGAPPLRDAAPSSVPAPASASSFCWARPISINGCFGTRRRSTAARAPAHPPASGSAAATAHRPCPRAPAAPRARAARSSEHGCWSIAACGSPIVGESRRHRGEREVARVAVVDLVPRQRRRHPRVWRRPHRVRAGNRAVLRVLVVVEEDAVAFFLPPLARRERRRAALDFARQAPARRGGPRRTSSAARCARRRACRATLTSWASRRARSRRASRGPRAPPRGPGATRRPAPDRDRRAARRDGRDRRRAPDADAARGRRGWPSTRAPPRRAARLPRRCGRRESAARRPRSTSGRESARASGRRTRRRCRSDSARARSAAARAAQRAVGDGEVVARRDRASCSRPAEREPCAGSRSQLRVRSTVEQLTDSVLLAMG